MKDFYGYVNFDERSRKLFCTLTLSALDRIGLRHIKKNQIVMCAGECANEMYIVLEGVCDILRDTKFSLYPVAVGEVGYLDVVGLYEIIHEQTRLGYLKAHTDCVMAVIDKETVLRWVQEEPRFMLGLATSIIERLFKESDWKNFSTKYSIYCGVVSFLISKRELFNKRTPSFEGFVKLEFTRQQIADAIGGDVRSVNRAIHRLKEENLIIIERGGLSINLEQQRRLEEIQAQIIR